MHLPVTSRVRSKRLSSSVLLVMDTKCAKHVIAKNLLETGTSYYLLI